MKLSSVKQASYQLKFKIEKVQLLKNIPALMIILTLGLLAGCSPTGSPDGGPDLALEDNFRESPGEWEPFFTDFNIEQEDGMNLRAEYRSLPEPLDTTDNGHFISAVNRSDDVKMMFRKQVQNLEPNTAYSVQFDLRFATEVPSGCVGIGGPPGEAVRVIADASRARPEPVLVNEYLRLNIQQSGDSQEWYQNAIMGDIANSRECEDGYQYEIKELNSEQGHATVISDENGSAWMMFGTRSGFEGQTDLFYTYFRAEFRQ